MSKKVSDVIRDAQVDDVYWSEWIIGDFLEELSEQMHRQGVSRAGLASRIRSSPAHVTQVLRGNRNLTIRSMAKLARAVNAVVRVHLAPMGSSTRWLDVVHPDASELDSGSQVIKASFGAPSNRDDFAVAASSAGSGGNA